MPVQVAEVGEANNLSAVRQKLQQALLNGAKDNRPGSATFEQLTDRTTGQSVRAIVVHFTSDMTVIDALFGALEAYANAENDELLMAAVESARTQYQETGQLNPAVLQAYGTLLASGQILFQNAQGQELTPQLTDQPGEGAAMAIVESPRSLKEAAAMLVAMGLTMDNAFAGQSELPGAGPNHVTGRVPTGNDWVSKGLIWD